MGHRDRMFKVLVVGDATVGKTSLVQRYANDSFNRHYKSTVGGEPRGGSQTGAGTLGSGAEVAEDGESPAASLRAPHSLLLGLTWRFGLWKVQWGPHGTCPGFGSGPRAAGRMLRGWDVFREQREKLLGKGSGEWGWGAGGIWAGGRGQSMSLLQLPAGRLQRQGRLFSQLTGDRMRGNSVRLCQGRFSVGVRRISLQKGTGTGCPGCWWHPHPRGCFRGAWMWHQGMWLNGGPGTVRCWLDLRLFKALFQPKRCCDHRVCFCSASLAGRL